MHSLPNSPTRPLTMTLQQICAADEFFCDGIPSTVVRQCLRCSLAAFPQNCTFAGAFAAMPAIRLAGCQLPVSSDDFVFAAIGSVLLRVAVIACLSVSIWWLSVPPWEESSMLGHALLADLAINLAGFVLDMCLGCRSAAGTIPELDRRASVKHLVVARLLSFALDMSAAAFLAVAAANHTSETSRSSSGASANTEHLDLLSRAVAAVSCTISLLQLCGIVPIAFGTRCAHEHDGLRNEAHDGGDDDERFGREAAERWQSRCNSFWCCCAHGGDRTDTLGRVGEVMAVVLGPSSRLGLTPSDFAAGLALVRMRQKVSGVSSDPEAALDRSASDVAALPGAVPFAAAWPTAAREPVGSVDPDDSASATEMHAAQQRSDTADLPEAAAFRPRPTEPVLEAPLAAGAVSASIAIDVGEHGTGSKDRPGVPIVIATGATPGAAELEQAAAWSRFAVAAYGCLLYSYMHLACGCCWLAAAAAADGCCLDRAGQLLWCACCCRRCRTGKDGRALAGRHHDAAGDAGRAVLVPVGANGGICGCDAAAARLVLGLPRSELVSLSFKGSVERRPFVVVRDVARRAVVVAVRGTMSLSDCVADADASPVDISPWVRRWKLLGRAGAAALAAGSQLEAHRAMWVGALNLVAELCRQGILERPEEADAIVTPATPDALPIDASADEGLPAASSGPEPAALPIVTSRSGRVAVPIAVNTAAAMPWPTPGECSGIHFAPTLRPPAGPDAPSDGDSAGHPKTAGSGLPASAPWQVVVVGHSLGAGVATLVGLALSGRYPGVKVHAYSPPGGLVSPALASALEGTATSFVLGKDMIPRLSLASARRMQHQILLELRGARVSKARLLASLWGAGCAGVTHHAVACCCSSPDPGAAAGCCDPDADAAAFGCPSWVCCGLCTVFAADHLAPLDDPRLASQLYGLHQLHSERSGSSLPEHGREPAAAVTRPEGESPVQSVPGSSALSPAAIAEAVASTAGFAAAVDRALVEDDARSFVGEAEEAKTPLLLSVATPRRLLEASSTRRALPRMRMPGRVVHLDRARKAYQRQLQSGQRRSRGNSQAWGGEGCICSSGAPPKPYTAADRPRDSFRDLIVSTLMVRDHMPDKIMRILDRVAAASDAAPAVCA